MSIQTKPFMRDNPCRLCLRECANINIFNDENMTNNIMKYCQVEVHKNDGLPNLICYKCMIKVDDITKFIKQCYENDSLLRNQFNWSKCNTDYQNTDEGSCGYDNEEMFSTELTKEETVNLNDENLMKTIQTSESGEEYLYYLGIKIIVNRSKLVEKNIQEQGKKRKKTFHLCHVCGETKSRKHQCCYNLKIPPIKCNICEKTFNKKHQLTNHLKTHSNERPHICDVCGRAAKTMDALKKHRKMVHFESLVLKLCPVCQKPSKTMSQLRRHIQIHTGQKDYECDYCQKRYSCKQSLIMHIRVHTREKPYKCTECSKSFALTSSLKEHIRLHTGEKPYACPICSKAFAQLGNMKSHFRHNHKNAKYEYLTPKRQLVGQITIPKK